MFLLLTYFCVSLLASAAPKGDDFKEPERKVPVKILLHHSGDLAAKFPYHQVGRTSLHVDNGWCFCF